jgi:DNA-directed RNA polymerase subunit M/transcription elongation factor TFIIS
MSIDNTLRTANVNNFKKILSNEKISKNIEDSIYNFSIEYASTNNTPYLIDSIYETKYNDIYDLLKNKENIISALIDKKIDEKKIAYMKPEELDPDKYENIIKKKELEEYKKNNEGVNTFTCSKCKEAKVKITQQQTRAGDEPPTIFVSCLNCGHTFKF